VLKISGVLLVLLTKSGTAKNCNATGYERKT